MLDANLETSEIRVDLAGPPSLYELAHQYRVGLVPAEDRASERFVIGER
jgi:hypothetical protein